ncbi:uncharacterized protein Tco025E_03437 [Trypanosoma conorhini]|uniref:MutL C-terminal dimerisation domain-containing protein n=1 Tax=Trypanosoma conorhini TaxID=83891 RepID=A0A422PV12_9TRYP|nr:uncharacterized protein Tco025E_03437 [Trypanosoma conorhini]RNF21357.1 hypothetical protein Tco025E_03437 [Trypanosoma conorhini]
MDSDGISGGVSLLPPCDAARIRAAHRVPSLAVAVEAAYQLLRSLPPPGPTHEIRVVAAPAASGFTVDLAGAYRSPAAAAAAASPRHCRGAAAGLSDLTAVSQELRLCVAVEAAPGRGRGARHTTRSRESLEILFERRWRGADTETGEDPWTGVCAALTAKLRAARQANEHQPPPLLLHLRCEVRGLFYCMPVRQRSAAGGSHTSYRLRAERQALLSAAYRMAVECILAPMYLSLHETAGAATSLCLHLSSSGSLTAAAVDTADVVYVENCAPQRGGAAASAARSTKRRREESEGVREAGEPSHTLSTAHRVLAAVFPHLRLHSEPLEAPCSNAASRLREAVVDAGKFAVLFLLPAWRPQEAAGRLGRRPAALDAVVVAKSAATTACHVVDEAHRVYRQVAHGFTTLCPLIVFLAESLLGSDDAALRRMFRAAERICRCGTATLPQETPHAPRRESPFAVVGDLTAAAGALRCRNVAAAGLRVSSLTQRLSAARRAPRAGFVDGAPPASVPRRTPFCPPSLAGGSCRASTLPQVRAAMRLTLDPARIAPRAYAAPSVWPGLGEADAAENSPCPFRARHFIAQWDRKFLLLHMSDTGGCAGASRLAAKRSPLSILPAAAATTGLLTRPSKQQRQQSCQHPLPPALYIVDQHALHERLRLEFFMATAESYVRHLPASVALHVPIPDDIRRDVTAYERVLAKWGWGFARGSPHCDGGGGATAAAESGDAKALRCCVAVTQWPHLELEGHTLHLDTMETLRATVEEFLTAPPPRQSPAAGGAEAVGDGDVALQNAGARVLPSAVLNFLITRSCRGAVMFGDSLPAAAVEQLIDALPAVAQYTLCSHGRPSFAVIRSRGT